MTTLAWRGLDGPRDLDLRLDGASRAGVTTRVLRWCLRPGDDVSEVDDEDLWSLTLAGRIGALASILRASGASDGFQLTFPCPSACGESVAVPLALATIESMAREAEAEPIVEISLDQSEAKGDTVRVRRPTGADVRAWERALDASEQVGAEDAELALAKDLIVGAGPADEEAPAVVATIADEMVGLDPLPAFRIVTRCPACDGEIQHDVDLEAELLFRLEARQHAVVAGVHRLARAYGWTEAEVLAVPAWRRARYLDLVDGGGVA